MERKGFFARVADLWRGFWGVKLSDAEARNAEAVYHNAITNHVGHHDKLKEAIARLVYLRNRMEADHKSHEKDLALVEGALKRALSNNDDDMALALIRKKKHFEAEVERLANELAALTGQTQNAKEGLQEVQLAIRRLKEERGQMLARKAHAVARRDAQEALKRLTDQSHLMGSVSALENVRESIIRLEHEVGLDDETPQLPGEVSMAQLRRDAQDTEDRAVLAELKEELGSHMLVEAEAELNGGNGKTLGPVEEHQTEALV
jgi:phage shock protein A